MKKLITIDEFLNDISDTSNLYVDVNSLCNISGATPIYVTYKVDKIIFFARHPSKLVLTSGESKIILSDIQRVTKTKVVKSSKSAIEYTVLCGAYNPFRKTLRVRRE